MFKDVMIKMGLIKEQTLVDKELFDRVNRLARRPVGPPKVPIYRTPTAKRNAFTVIKGNKK